MLHTQHTPHGHTVPEVASAFQKAVRRGELDNALYWAVQLHLANFHEYAWKRIRIMVSEDIGPANPTLPAQIDALYTTYCLLRKKDDGIHEPWRICFVHAVILIAQSPKSRIVDHATMVHFNDVDNLKRPIPDEALDKHTIPGKQRGRGWQHFFAEGTKLAGEIGADPYRSRAREVMTALPDRRKKATSNPPPREPTPAPPRNGHLMRTVVFAGRFADEKGNPLNRDDLCGLAERKGWIVAGSVDDKTSLVVSTRRDTAKATEASLRGVQVATLEEFLQMT